MKVEVKQKESKPINWDKPQLVIRKDINLIVLTSGVHGVGTFSGIVVNQGDHTRDVGHYSESWNKCVFELFEGEIVITQ